MKWKDYVNYVSGRQDQQNNAGRRGRIKKKKKKRKEKEDIRRVHYNYPTRTRTYIPVPFHNLLCTYPPTSGHSPSIGSSTSLPEPCQV